MAGGKKFIILIYGTGEGMMKMPEAERKAHMGKWDVWFKSLKKEGQLVGGDPFSPEAKTIRGKAMKVSDGYFVPNKKHAIGGYIMVKAGSMSAAVAIAKGCPTFELGGNLEVREVVKM